MRTKILPFLLAALLTACSSPSGGGSAALGDTIPVHLQRFEQVLFDTPVGDLQTRLQSERENFQSPLLNCEPDNPNYMQMLRGFVSDPTLRYIYRITDSLYHDLGWLEHELGIAMGRAHELCPEMEYNKYYTLLTADFDNYDTRIFCYNREMAISIDRYALGAMGQKDFFGVPAYLVQLCRREYIVPDCIAAAAMDHISLPDHELTLLDFIIYRGKVLYFLDKVLPAATDAVKLRYTPEQLDWMQGNVQNVWGWLIQKEMLYSTDLSLMRNLISDAPRTNAFGEGSAPRTCDYIGWQIVKKYMAHGNITVNQLFADTESQKILELSGWRP